MSQNGDIETQQKMFDSVMGMIKWGTVATVSVVIFVVILVAS